MMTTTTVNIPIIKYGDQEGPSGLLFARRINVSIQGPFCIQNAYLTELDQLPLLRVAGADARARRPDSCKSRATCLRLDAWVLHRCCDRKESHTVMHRASTTTATSNGANAAPQPPLVHRIAEIT